MTHASPRIQSEAFTADLTPHMEAARRMYPGGRFRRAFDRVFRRGMVEMTDEFNAMVIIDREQRAALAENRVAAEATAMGRSVLPAEPGRRTMRETLLADTYGRQDRGQPVYPGELAWHEGLVQEERTSRQAQHESGMPSSQTSELLLPPGGVIDADAFQDQLPPQYPVG